MGECINGPFRRTNWQVDLSNGHFRRTKRQVMGAKVAIEGGSRYTVSIFALDRQNLFSIFVVCLSVIAHFDRS